MRALWPPNIKPPDCAGCPYAIKGRGFVPGVGDLETPKIFAVFEKPGKNEANEGIPLIGATGRRVENALAGWHNVYRTNVRKCLVEDRSRDQQAKIDRMVATDHCIKAYLSKEVEYLNRLGTVRVTLLGGGDAARAFFRYVDMHKFHSTVWTRDEVEAISSAVVQAEQTAGSNIERTLDDNDIPF